MWVWSFAGRNDTSTSARGQSQPVEIASLATSTRTCVVVLRPAAARSSRPPTRRTSAWCGRRARAAPTSRAARDTRRRSSSSATPISSGSGVFGAWSTSSGCTTSRQPLRRGVLCPPLGRVLQLPRGAAHEDGVEVAGLVRDVEDDGVLDQPGLLHADRVDDDGRQRAPVLVASASCIASLNRSIVAEMPHTIGIGGVAVVAVDEPRTMVGLSRRGLGVEAAVCLVEDQVDGEVVGRRSCWRSSPRSSSPAGRARPPQGRDRALGRRRRLDVPARQQRGLGELLGVEEVDLARARAAAWRTAARSCTRSVVGELLGRLP